MRTINPEPIVPQWTRRYRFNVEKTTTSKAVGYVVIFQFDKKANPEFIKVLNGRVSWTGHNQCGTIFRTKTHALKAIERVCHNWINTTRQFTILPVGNAEKYS